MDAKSDLNATDVDEDEDESAWPSPEVRYIDFVQHPAFAVHTLSDTELSPTFLIRQEYLEFMDHAITKIKQKHFFLTGQPGIGKSMGICYFLFRLLALGESVFFLPNTSEQVKASVWYMKPWSSQEIAAVTKQDEKDRQDVQDRFQKGGLVARSLSTDNDIDDDIDDVINVALAADLFAFMTGKACHQMFLIHPRERTNCSFNFLSNLIADRTAELAEKHAEKVQGQLAHSPAIRPAAGKLIDFMLHRALIHKQRHVRVRCDSLRRRTFIDLSNTSALRIAGSSHFRPRIEYLLLAAVPVNKFTGLTLYCNKYLATQYLQLP
ncbi:hypothetical protein C8R44DRAFT_893087 [Mycena epipterygia]|nr:hypothetical protein C8R44DRAFT_893087 [Mycena epipterygia]